MKRFKHYQQNNTADCGPACLQMIAAYYGKYYTLERLNQLSFVTREGVSMRGIAEAAERIGFKVSGVKTTLEILFNDATLPCILYWNQRHFVVLYKIRTHHNKKVYYIADPASECVKYDEEELCQSWISTYSAKGKPLGIVLVLQPTQKFYDYEGEATPGLWHDLTYYLRYLLPYKGQFMQLAAGMFIGSVIQLIFPFLTQTLVDKGIGDKDLNFITLVLIAQIVLFLTQLGINSLRSWITLHINARIDISLISDFLAKLMRLPLKFFDSKLTGDLIQRIGDHSRVKSFLMGNTVNIIFSTINFIIYACILAYYDIFILTIFLFGNILYVAWIAIFMRYRRELDVKRFNQSAKEQSSIIQIIHGMADIKLNNCERQKRWEWERIQARMFKINVKGLAIGQIQQAGTIFFSQGSNIIITFLAATSVVKGTMTLGMMMSLTYIVGQLSAPIMELINFLSSLQDAKISIERLNEINKHEDEEKNISKKLTVLPINKGIEFNRVTFSYSGAEHDYAINDVSFTIPSGKITAIVGASGCGKTTILKMLQGFYSPLHGNIKVGGVPLDSINPHIWRAASGAVMQEGFIFSDTLARNIAVGYDEIDEKRLALAIRIANLSEFISTLPLGLSTRIGMDGNGISAGQKQRVLIARAIYKDPEVIFFDEATNSLDAVNEHIIMDNLKQYFKGKTVVIVAHRLSTIIDSDKVIVMDKGSIVEEGTHETLLAMKGHYYALLDTQMNINKDGRSNQQKTKH